MGITQRRSNMANEISNDQDLSKKGFHLMPANPGTCMD